MLIFFQKINCFCQLHKEHIRNEITDNKELDEIKEKFDWNDNIREICVLQCGFDWIFSSKTVKIFLNIVGSACLNKVKKVIIDTSLLSKNQVFDKFNAIIEDREIDK